MKKLLPLVLAAALAAFGARGMEPEVTQIAAAHGGRARFYSGEPFRCELRLPALKT